MKETRKNKFKQRIPAGVDFRINGVEFEFEKTEDIISHPFFESVAESKNFEKFVISENMIMAIFEDGYVWRVLGYVTFPSRIELPQWEGAKERTEPEPELLEVVVEQKTSESSPITDADRAQLKEMFGDEDIIGGMQNIDIPETALDKIKEQYEKASEFIDLHDESTDVAHKMDGVSVVFTPEEMMVLIQILEQNATASCCVVDYASNILNMDLYGQQGYVRQLRDRVDGTLDEYVKVRPFSPFLSGWVKKIGKSKIRTDAQK